MNHIPDVRKKVWPNIPMADTLMSIFGSEFTIIHCKGEAMKHEKHKCGCELCTIGRRMDASHPNDEQRAIMNDLFAIAENDGLNKDVADMKLDAIRLILDGGMRMAGQVLDMVREPG